MLVLGLISALPFLALSVASFLNLLRDGGTGVGFAFLAFASLGGILVFGYYRDYDELDPTGIRYRTTFGPSGSATWADVRSVRYSESMKWFRLDLQNGKCTRISAMMIGLPDFARLVLEYCPHAEIDEKTRSVLMSTSSGNPPRIWQ